MGNFDGDLISAGDTDICHRILSGGGTLLFDPKAVVYHIPRDSIFALIQQFLGYGIGQARLAHKEHSLRTGIATARVEHLRGIVAIVRNILLFITRLVTTPFRTDDVLFPILSGHQQHSHSYLVRREDKREPEVQGGSFLGWRREFGKSMRMTDAGDPDSGRWQYDAEK